MAAAAGRLIMTDYILHLLVGVVASAITMYARSFCAHRRHQLMIWVGGLIAETMVVVPLADHDHVDGHHGAEAAHHGEPAAEAAHHAAEQTSMLFTYGAHALIAVAASLLTLIVARFAPARSARAGTWVGAVLIETWVTVQLVG